MRTLFLIIGIGVVAGLDDRPAAAHSPYYSHAEVIDSPGYEDVSLKLLHGDGIFFADPVRAVVVDREGILLAASPLSPTLGIFCKGEEMSRRCLAYDYLSRVVYEPDATQWQNAGAFEKEGRPLWYQEVMEKEFGFLERSASVAEMIAFEIEGALRSWRATSVAVAWWTLLWLLVLPILQAALRVRPRPSALSIALRVAGSILMVPMAAYGWLLAPYSILYLISIVTVGAVTAMLIGRLKRTLVA